MMTNDNVIGSVTYSFLEEHKMSKKNTKRALLSSVLALVLCFAMLTGTTFA